MVRFYPSIPHNEGTEILKKQLENFDEISIPTKDLVKMAEFVLKNNNFEFNSNVKHEISETATGTKFAPPYACLYQSSHSVKWQESSQSHSSHQNSRVKERKLLTSF